MDKLGLCKRMSASHKATIAARDGQIRSLQADITSHKATIAARDGQIRSLQAEAASKQKELDAD